MICVVREAEWQRTKNQDTEISEQTNESIRLPTHLLNLFPEHQKFVVKGRFYDAPFLVPDLRGVFVKTNNSVTSRGQRILQHFTLFKQEFETKMNRLPNQITHDRE